MDTHSWGFKVRVIGVSLIVALLGAICYLVFKPVQHICGTASYVSISGNSDPGNAYVCQGDKVVWTDVGVDFHIHFDKSMPLKDVYGGSPSADFPSAAVSKTVHQATGYDAHINGISDFGSPDCRGYTYCYKYSIYDSEDNLIADPHVIIMP
jgi:hypothetical protein